MAEIGYETKETTSRKDKKMKKIVFLSVVLACTLANLTWLTLHDNPLNYEACKTHLPVILFNNQSMDLQYDPCADGYTLTVSSGSGGSVTMQ